MVPIVLNPSRGTSSTFCRPILIVLTTLHSCKHPNSSRNRRFSGFKVYRRSFIRRARPECCMRPRKAEPQRHTCCLERPYFGFANTHCLACPPAVRRAPNGRAQNAPKSSISSTGGRHCTLRPSRSARHTRTGWGRRDVTHGLE